MSSQINDQMKALADKLGLTDKQVQSLRVKYGSDEATMRRLRRWVEETRDRSRLLGKTGGYTERPGFALRVTVVTETGREDEPEAVDEMAQKRITRDARARQLQASADVIAAAEGVMAAIKDRADQSPEFRREARLTMHRIRRELDRFIERQRRKAA